MTLYRALARPLLFRLDPERVHDLALRTGHWAGTFAPARAGLAARYGFASSRLATRVAGIDFPNPIGLAGGFDKNGLAMAAAEAIGFGSLEVGSVSLHPSAGNPGRPRLFRVPADEALMVNYGVPNDGAQAVAARLAAHRCRIPIGVNLVETNTGVVTAADAVIDELVGAARVLGPRADYLVLNLNCPNSAGGASVFDDPAVLRTLLDGLTEVGVPPVFLKSRAQGSAEAIDPVIATAEAYPFVVGFIPAATVPRPYRGFRTAPEVLAAMPGTLSGPFRHRVAVSHIRLWASRIDRERHVLFGAGGVRSAEDAYAMIRAGASIVQLLTALVYRGPALVREIKAGLDALLARDGFAQVADAVGADG